MGIVTGEESDFRAIISSNKSPKSTLSDHDTSKLIIPWNFTSVEIKV